MGFQEKSTADFKVRLHIARRAVLLLAAAKCSLLLEDDVFSYHLHHQRLLLFQAIDLGQG
jgi:hypothetical protein